MQETIKPFNLTVANGQSQDIMGRLWPSLYSVRVRL